MSTTKGPTGANLLLKAIAVLDAIGRADTPPRLTEIAAQTGLPLGTAHRILDTLTSERLLRREEASRSFRLGPRLLQLARGAWEDLDVRAAAVPELDALQAALGQTVLLTLLVDNALLVIERRQARDAVRTAPGIGSSLKLHCTAAGKAVLSALDGAERARWIGGMALTSAAPRTIIDAVTLRANLELAASHNYALDDEESGIGVRGCAAPILNQQGRPFAALAFTGAAELLSIARCREIGTQLAAAAERISWNLGYNPPERWADLAISRMHDDITPVGAARAFVGGNPVWSPRANGLYWIDRTRPAIWFEAADGSSTACPLPEPAQGLTEGPGGLLVVRPSGLYACDFAAGRFTRLHELIGAEPSLRYAAAEWDARGRLWIATMDRSLGRPAGCLYRIDPDFTAHPIISGLLFPLGIAWSPDHDRIYLSDGPKREIYCAAFDLESGEIGPTEVFARIPDSMGRPTGLAVDAEGGVWNAQSEGWRVTRYTAGGDVDQVLSLPVPRPIGCGFGGADRRTLYITTARQGIPDRRLAEVPLSGAVLSYRTKVPGARGVVASMLPADVERRTHIKD